MCASTSAGLVKLPLNGRCGTARLPFSIAQAKKRKRRRSAAKGDGKLILRRPVLAVKPPRRANPPVREDHQGVIAKIARVAKCRSSAVKLSPRSFGRGRGFACPIGEPLWPAEWIGTVEAVDKSAAIEEAAELFKANDLRNLIAAQGGCQLRRALFCFS
jgi:hypothetical protein